MLRVRLVRRPCQNRILDVRATVGFWRLLDHESFREMKGTVGVDGSDGWLMLLSFVKVVVV